ncbi:MAG: PCYCGC motif-containing (lipo)protein [Thermoleophilia bacterium]
MKRTIKISANKSYTVMGFIMVISAAMMAALLFSGCGSTAENDPAFPEFVYRSEQSLEGYRIAAASQDIMEFVPCYCGCNQDADKYRSLKDCFYDRKTGEYDEHAASCTTCLDEAVDINQWKKEGLTTAEIRERIDTKYAERGEPTDTPMP